MRGFRIVLIKPSHYDDDGYVIQWHRSGIPSNSLASVYAAFAECAAERVLGPGVDITLEGYDECNTIIDVDGIIRRIRRAGGGFLGFVGVQTNQFARALDLARAFRAADLPVVIGGFHVSGTMAMLPELTPELKEAVAAGITLYAGEAEGRMAELVRDIDGGTLKPIYNYLNDLPDLAGATLPLLPRAVSERVHMTTSTFDAGRGCPFQCSFCTIINVQGRKSRYRTADDVEAIVRANAAQGIKRFFVTDDDFARNRNWEAILDRLADLRLRQGFELSLVLQVDTLCHRIPGFVEKAARAGCRSVFIGLENINPESLMGAKKRQNKIWEYREMLLGWRRVDVSIHAGYILGFPADTPETIARDIDIIKRELPIDLLEFFFLTPLPGSEDHRTLYQRGAPLEADMNKYDLEHPCADHPRMTRQQWIEAYNDAWKRYYSRDHMETIMRRAAASGISLSKISNGLMIFAGATTVESLHPLQCGIGRRKVRTQRRPGMPRESPLVFYPRRAVEIVFEVLRWAQLAIWVRLLRKGIAADSASRGYMDEALAPAAEDLLVQAFADKVPNTHGAPRRPAVV
jgi:radical SAM family protein